jgi:hypothetical protein
MTLGESHLGRRAFFLEYRRAAFSREFNVGDVVDVDENIGLDSQQLPAHLLEPSMHLILCRFNAAPTRI